MSNMTTSADEFLWTYIDHRGEGEWPYTLCGFIRHERDLSDLAPPYHKAVKEALALKEQIRRASA